MPEGYPVAFEDEGSIHEQMLGRGDAKRTTKTFIEDGPLAMYLGFVRFMPKSIMNAGRRMYAQEHDVFFEEVTPEMLISKYPEVQEYLEIHQQIVEHKGSQGGFLVQSYVAKDKQENSDKHEPKQESSGESKGKGKRWT